MSVMSDFTEDIGIQPEGSPYRARIAGIFREIEDEREIERISLLDQMCREERPLYYIVKGGSERQTQDRVQELLERGWELCGGVSYYKDGYGEHFIQSMHKPKGSLIKDEGENHFNDVDFNL